MVIAMTAAAFSSGALRLELTYTKGEVESRHGAYLLAGCRAGAV
jgi:hypothetical protein